MADIDNTSAPSSDPGLQPYLDRVESMDWLDDVPSTSHSNVPLKTKYTLELLSPDMRRPLQDKLAAVPAEQRAAAEARLVQEAVRERVLTNRGLIGVGGASLPYHRELAQIAGDVHQIDGKIEQYEEDIAAIRGHRSVADPVTGKLTAEPIPLFSPERRKAYEANIVELRRHRRLLINDDDTLGIQGAQQLEVARQESARILKRLEEDKQDAAEVTRLIAERVRKDRINKQVEAQVRLAQSGDHR